MTNGDRIRKMKDKNLSYFLAELSGDTASYDYDCCWHCENCSLCNICATHNSKECEKGIEEWLKQEAKQ